MAESQKTEETTEVQERQPAPKPTDPNFISFRHHAQGSYSTRDGRFKIKRDDESGSWYVEFGGEVIAEKLETQSDARRVVMNHPERPRTALEERQAQQAEKDQTTSTGKQEEKPGNKSTAKGSNQPAKAKSK